MNITTTAFSAECPYCNGQLVGTLDIATDADCGLKVRNPCIVVDTYLALSPDCALATWAPPARSTSSS